MKFIRNLVAFLLAAGAISGCIVFPTGVPEEKPFKEESEDFFVPGSATAEDVRSKLGEPAMQQDKLWLYRDTRDGWRWAICAGAGYTGGCGGLPRGSEDYFLVVDFDADGVVTATTLLKEDELCDVRHLCFESELLMREASPAEDAEAKLFRAPPTGCYVFTYSDTDSDSAAGYLIIDGEMVGSLVGTSGYYLHTVAPGPHAWLVAPIQKSEFSLPTATAPFNCGDQPIAFLRYRKGFWSPTIEPVNAETGKRDIGERWLAISEPEYGDMMQSNWLRNDEIFVTKQKNTVTAYQLIEGQTMARWGMSTIGEPCGMRAALEDYGLTPLGANSGLLFGESLTSHVEVHGICKDATNCSFRSVIDGEVCNAVLQGDFEFQSTSKQLVLEADGDTYKELYYGDAGRLKKVADCRKGLCTMRIDQLRELQ